MDEFTSVGDLPQQIAVETAPTSKWHRIRGMIQNKDKEFVGN